MKKTVEKLAYSRIMETQRKSGAEKRLEGFSEELEGAAKERLGEIIEDMGFEKDMTERDIYIMGLKDGFALAEYILKREV